MNKKCIFIIGPESSGNRLMARLLTHAGFFGDGDIEQRLDTLIHYKRIPASIDKIVLLRSFPHGHGEYRHWPDMQRLKEDIEELGFVRFAAIVMVRDWRCAALSQVKNKHVRDATEALFNLHRFYAETLHSLPMGFCMVNYEALVHQGLSTFNWVLNMLDEPLMKELSEYIYDGNKKWTEVSNE